MKIVLRIVAGIVILVLLIIGIGFALPETHTASVRTVLQAPADSVYTIIADVERGASWRSGLEQVEVLAREPLQWRETADWGTITFVRIATSPNQAGSILTITENGSVSETYARDLAKRLGETAEPTRID